MASKRKQPPQGFPAVPSSLNAGDYEMRGYAGNAALPNSAAPYYTPYLGLPARLSQIWLNRWTVLILLVLVRFFLAIKGLDYDIANAKSEAMSACTSVENVGSAMASLPHYASEGVNAMVADGVNKAFSGFMQMLMLTVTGVEEIVLFYINYLYGTYECLIALVITGSLQVAIQMIEAVGNAMNKSISSITGDMDTVISTFQTGINDFLKGINDVGSIFNGGNKVAPTINLTSEITNLNSIHIDPTTMDADLNRLSNNLPNYTTIHQATNDLISLPFEEVKKLINESMSGYKFDSSVFPIAEKKQLTFCSDDPAIQNFFGGLVKILYDARTIGFVTLSILAVVMCIPMGYVEIRRWNSMKKRSVRIQDNAYDRMDVVYIEQHPHRPNHNGCRSE
jgi:hypothetical protein